MSAIGSFANLLKHAKNYFVADIASKALGLVSIPVFTRMLALSDYGVYSIFTAYAGIIAIILTLNAHAAVGRYFYDYTDDFNEFFGTSVLVVMGTLGLSSLVVISFKHELSQLLTLPENLVLLLIPYALVEVCFSFFIQIFQPLRESGLVARVNIVRIYFSFIISVVLLFLMGKDKYLGIILGQLAASGIIACYLVCKMRPYFVLAFNFNHLKYLLSYSLPLLFYSLNGAILNQCDRLLINRYCGADEAGLYSLSYNLGTMICLVSGALLTAWTPDYVDNMKSKNYAKLHSEVDRLLKLITCCAIPLILFGKDFGMMLSPEKYHGGLMILPLVTFGCFFDSVWQLYGRHFGYSGKTIYMAYLGVFSSSVNFGLNVLFIPRFGYKSAALTTLFSYFLMAFAAVFVTKYIIKLYPVTVKLVINPIVYLVLSILVFYVLDGANISILLKEVIKLMCFVLFLYGIFIPYMKTYNTSLRDLIKSVFLQKNHSN